MENKNKKKTKQNGNSQNPNFFWGVGWEEMKSILTS